MSVAKNEVSNKFMWYCHSCGVGGTETEAVMQALNISRKDANTWLVMQGYTPETELDKRTRERTDAFERFLAYTNKLLVEDTRDAAKSARTYLAGRKISSELWPRMAIGLYPTMNEVQLWLNENNIPEQLHAAFLPSNEEGRVFSENSIAFFYRASFNTFSRIKIRNIIRERSGSKDKCIQWLGPAKKKTEKSGFFAPGRIPTRSDKAVVVEGEFDAILMWQLCECNEAIYSFGGGGDMDTGVAQLMTYGCSDETVYVFPDNDDPGLNYLQGILSEYTHVSVFQPKDYKEGEDPADWCKRHNLDDLMDAFENSIKATDYVVEKYVEALGKAADDDEKQKIQESIIKYAHKLIPQYTVIEKLVDATVPFLGCSKDALMNEINGSSNNTVGFRAGSRAEYGTYYNKSKEKAKPSWEKVSSVIVRGVKAIKEQLNPSIPGQDNDMRSSLDGYGNTFLVYKVSNYDRTETIRLTTDEAADDRKFISAITGALGFADVYKTNIGYIRAVATEFLLPEKNTVGGQIDVVKKYCGWDDDFKRFLIPGGIIDIDGYHTSKECGLYVDIVPDAGSKDNKTDPGIYRQFFLTPAPADMEFAKKLIREQLINIFPHYVTLPLLAHAFTAPLIGLYNLDKFAFWLYGRTGKGKSTFATILASFYGNFWEKRNGNMGPVTWGSTAFSIEKIGNPLRNMLYLVDDFKTGRAATGAGIKLDQIRDILQSYADNTGKYRWGASSTINGLLLCTGEDLPLNESSLKGRSLVIQLNEPGDRFLAENFYANHCIHLPGIMAGFIQFLLKKKMSAADVRNHILKWKQRIAGIIKGLDSESHSRTENNLTLNACAWELLAEYLGLEDLTDEYVASIAKIANYMAHFQEDDDPCQEFLGIILDQIASGRCYLEGKDGPNSSLGATGKGSQLRIGEVHKDFVILYTQPAREAVSNAYRAVNGCQFPHSFKSLGLMMADKGWLLKEGEIENGIRRKAVKLSGAKGRGYFLRRELFNLDMVTEQTEEMKILAVNEGNDESNAEGDSDA